MGQIEELLLKLSHNPSTLKSVPPIAVGRVENQNEPKRPPLCGRLGSFWFSTRFTRKTLDYSNGTYTYKLRKKNQKRKKKSGIQIFFRV